MLLKLAIFVLLVGVRHLVVGVDLRNRLVHFHLADRQKLIVVRLAERRPVKTGKNLLLCLVVRAIREDEVGDLLLQACIEILAPNQRVRRDQRRRPDHAQISRTCPGFLLDARKAFAVVCSRINQLVGNGKSVGFMVRVANGLEALLRVDASWPRR